MCIFTKISHPQDLVLAKISLRLLHLPKAHVSVKLALAPQSDLIFADKVIAP